MARDQSPVLPGTVAVRFTPWLCDTTGGDWSQVPTSYSVSTSLSNASLDAATAQGTTQTWTVRDTCHAIFSAKGKGDPTNKTVLQTLADQIGLDRWNWRTVAFDRSYNGIVAPPPDGTIDAVTWTYRGDECSTRISSVPVGAEVDRLAHMDVLDDCDGCVTVFPETAKQAGGTVTLPRAKLCLQGGELVTRPIQPDTFAGCCTPAGPCPGGFPCGYTWDQVKGLSFTVRYNSGNITVQAVPAHYVDSKTGQTVPCWSTPNDGKLLVKTTITGCEWTCQTTSYTDSTWTTPIAGDDSVYANSGWVCPQYNGTPNSCPVINYAKKITGGVLARLLCAGGSPYGPYTPAQSLPPIRATGPAPAPAARPAIRAYLALSAAARACPHRTAPACGCAQVPGSCALGKGGDRGVTLADCVACQKHDRVEIRGHLNNFTGYGQHVAAIGMELEKLGMPVTFDPIERVDGGFLPLADFVKGRVKP